MADNERRKAVLIGYKYNGAAGAGWACPEARRHRTDQSWLDPDRTLAPGGLCQFLLDRQEIAPGEPLLQRAAQQEGRVIGRHGANLTPPGVEGEPAAARFGDPFLGGEQGLTRGVAE